MSDVQNASYRGPAGPAAAIGVGQVFDKTYRTFRRAPGRLIGIGLCPLIVSVISVVPGLFRNPNDQSPTTAIVLAIASLIITLLQYTVQIASQGASIYAGGRLLAGSSFTVGEAFGAGFRRFWPMLGLWILIALIIVVGLVLLVVPGLIAICVLAAAMQACILERRGPIESIKRSAYLTTNNRWRVLGAYFLTFLPIIAAFVVLVGVSIGIFTIFRDAPLPLMIGVGIILVLMLILVALVSAGITGAFLSVLFVELRQAKDGIGAREGVAGVFD